MMIKMMINEHIGIRQFFTCQNFPNPDSSKFSTVKNLRHTVRSYHQEKIGKFSPKPLQFIIVLVKL